MAEATAQPAAAPGTWIDPYRAYNFKLLVNNVTEGHFTAVSGLGVKVERIAYREAGANAIVRSVPGQVTYSAVTLSYGLTAAVELWDWLMAAVEGRVSRRNVSIAMLDSSGAQEVLRWNLLNAWPSEWHGAPLDAMSRELAVESLTLAHEGLERDNAGAPSSGPAGAAGR